MDNSKYKTTSKVDYRDLSDVDFIRNLDALATNYYSDYMQGRAQITGSIDSFISRTSIHGCVATPYPLYPPRNKEVVGYFFRRNFFVFFCFLFSVLEIVYLALSFFDIGFLHDYLPFISGGMLLSEPVKVIFGSRSSAFPYEGFVTYLVSGGILLFGLFSVLSLIISCVALFSKRKKDGTFKRYRLGIFSIVRLVGVIIAGVGILLLHTQVGYGAILLAATAFLSFLFSFACYKKATARIPETYFDAYGNLKEGCSPVDFVGK